MTDYSKHIRFRQLLHSEPELSGKEFVTKQRILEFIKQFKPNAVHELAETGLAVEFSGKTGGKTLMFRADIDALPFSEESSLDYQSKHEGVMHACGHDGHTSILTALAEKLHRCPPQSGRVILLFQPAEETGEGALQLLNDPKFESIKPDYIFGLHNIPGEPMHSILLKSNAFASASEGLIIRLKGKSAHAAEPENGLNPVWAVESLTTEIRKILDNPKGFKDFVLITVIHIKLGEIAFGTSPGEAVMMLTLRSSRNDDMEKLRGKVMQKAEDISKSMRLKVEFEHTEVFPATENHPEAFEILEESLLSVDTHEIKYLETPFRWSEDFGNYLNEFSGAFFGLGSGINQPKLHNPDYNFPDELIATGSDIFYRIADYILNKQ